LCVKVSYVKETESSEKMTLNVIMKSVKSILTFQTLLNLDATIATILILEAISREEKDAN
jgi:hypothetical protein